MDAFTSSGNYLGTDRIGRALTKEESARFGRLLREHDYVGGSMVALRFAYRLTRGRRASARDLMARANLRLVCQGWDPNAVALRKRLCRLVWSEHTHAVSEELTARAAEEAFLREEGIQDDLRPASATHGDPLKPQPREPAVPSYEQQLARLSAERDDDAKRARRLAQHREDLATLRADLRASDDTVNEAWTGCQLRGITDLDAIVTETGHTKDELYAAQKRRQRAIRNVLAKRRAIAPDDEEKNDDGDDA